MCTCSKMNSICSKKSARAALNYSKGRSRGAYRLRGTICTGIRSRGEDADSSNQGSVCQQCTSLLDLRSIFDSLVHSGSNLKRRKKGYYKPPGSSYRNIKEQNNYLLRILFDGKGNYLYHRDCIRYAFKVSTSRLARLRRTVLSGITEMHDVLVVRKHGKVVLQDRKLCFGGEYSVLHNRKSNSEHLLPDLLPYEPVELSAEKFRHLREQHTKYIKQDVPLYEFPTFLQETQAATLPPITTSKQRKRYCAFPGCDGSGHIDPGRKRHLCERNCPLAAKKVAM